MKISPKFLCRIKNINDSQKLALSFSGCGFLGAYHFGAAKSLQKHGIEKLLPKVERIAGASAGSLVASIIVLAPDKINACMDALYCMADDVHAQRLGAMTPGYNINEKLQILIDQLLPADISNAQEKLYVSVTDAKTWTNILINKFDNRDHLISVLLASCYIPMYSSGIRGVPLLIHDMECIDGGLSNNLPMFHDIPTITCSPFSSIADICPDDPRSTWNVTFGKQVFMANSRNIVRGARALFPPKRKVLKEYYENGYEDAKRFISRIPEI